MKEEQELSANLMSADLLYRNQFLLGPRFIDYLNSWKKIQISDWINLSLHPDLPVHQEIEGDKSITLLGYVLDPRDPSLSNADIVASLVRKLYHCDNFMEHTYAFGGRWILIVNDGRRIILFNDAAGLRQIFYMDTACTHELWCASQPGLI